jgi:phosphate transport system substrate-binding protein
MKPRRRCILGTLTAFLSVMCAAATTAAPIDYLSSLSPYRASAPVSGTIRVWGNPYIPGLVEDWEQGFRALHPRVRFETDLKSTEAAMAGLYGGIADVVFIGREPYAPEIQAYEEWFGHAPVGVKITSGSYATQHKTFALMVYVNKDNPLAGMTLAQLDAIYSAERRRGESAPIREWGQLGLTGAWAHRPIHVYGYNFETGMAGFFRLTVMKDSLRWNPELKDFDNGRTAAGEVINAGTYILDAVAHDPDGIGFANVLFENDGVRKIALAEQAGGPMIEPTQENAWRRTWPLTRYSTAFVNRVPGQPIEPRVTEFLRYILSRDGMAAVVRDKAFLPLNADAIRTELGKLQ